ncbi:MAG: 16S rRNA (cytidine(1402)-2'-O)-methyltransferase [Bdellovibrionia bacterium]
MIPTMNDTKRQNLPQILSPGLWVVATPIGNLADLSPRCRSALEEADWILCEDTRRTLNLLRALGLPSEGRLKRLDAHTEADVSSYWIDKLLGGAKVALVSDAGTPVVSDPGAVLVARASSAGIRVTPLPGPSAVMTLLAASGFQETAFTFRGFFPRKRAEQVKELEQAFRSAEQVSPIWIWFESPQRIEESLKVLSTYYPSIPTTVGKELTKVFERIFYGTSTSVAEQVSAELQREGSVGEWCFSACFPVKKMEKNPQELVLKDLDQTEAAVDDNTDWVKAVKCLLTAGISASETARIVSQQFGISKKICYRLVILHSQYKKNV